MDFGIDKKGIPKYTDCGSSPKAVRHNRRGRETELDVDSDKRKSENVTPCRNSQPTDRTQLHWAEIEDVLTPTKIDGTSSDTESEFGRRKPNSRRPSSTRKST